jgi:hypothetical protein
VLLLQTTGGDRAKLAADVKAADLYAVIAPQMGKQVRPVQQSWAAGSSRHDEGAGGSSPQKASIDTSLDRCGMLKAAANRAASVRALSTLQPAAAAASASGQQWQL